MFLDLISSPRLIKCYIVLAALAAALSSARAQDLDRCIAPWSALPNAQPANEFWNSDRQVSVFRRETGGRYSYRIAGDIVELTPQLFPALDKPLNQAPTNIDTLRIDARELIVGMPIRIAEGSLYLAADKITFTGDGYLTIVDPPSATQQIIEIQAGVLDFSMARSLPFAFATQGWKLNEAPRWPVEGSSKRIFRLKAGSIIPGVNEPPEWKQLLKDRPLRWVHNKTADRGFDSGLPQEVWSKYYEVSVGADGASSYEQLMRDSLFWPDLTAMKLARLRSRNPFDPATNTFVAEQIAALSGRFENRTKPRAANMLNAMRAQIENSTDPFGYGPYSVPMQDLAIRLKQFGEDIERILGKDGKGGLLELWDATRVAGLESGTIEDVEQRANEILGLIEAVETERMTLASRITTNLNSLNKLVLKVSDKLREAEILDIELMQEYETKKREAEKIGQAVKALEAVSIVVSIAYPPAAPFAMGVSQTVSTGAALYYAKYNKRSLIEAAKSIKEIAGRYKKYSELVSQFDAAWKTSEQHSRAALRDITGREKSPKDVEAFEEAAKKIAAAGQAIYEQLTAAPTETAIDIVDYHEIDPDKDARRRNFIKQAEAIGAAVPTLQESVRLDRERVLLIDAEIVRLGAARVELLALKNVPNTERSERQALLASTIREVFLTDLARSAVLLRKGFFYVTGSWPDMPEEILFVADDALASKGWDEDHAQQFDPTQMKAALEETRQNLYKFYSTFSHYLDGEMRKYREAKLDSGSIDQVYFRASTKDKGLIDPEEERVRLAFLAAINRSIRNQIELAQRGEDGAGFQSRPILIPMRMSPPSDKDPMRLLLGISLTKIETTGSKNAADKLRIEIAHPRWGNVYFNGTCFRVSDAAADSPSQYEFSQEYRMKFLLPDDVRARWEELLTAKQLFSDIITIALPLEAPYYLYVLVPNPGAWKTVPTIETIQMNFVYTGARWK